MESTLLRPLKVLRRSARLAVWTELRSSARLVGEEPHDRLVRSSARLAVAGGGPSKYWRSSAGRLLPADEEDGGGDKLVHVESKFICGGPGAVDRLTMPAAACPAPAR